MTSAIDLGHHPAAAFGFYQEFATLDAGWSTFPRHYLLYASSGVFQLEVAQMQWLLPPQRAAWIAAFRSFTGETPARSIAGASSGSDSSKSRPFSPAAAWYFTFIVYLFCPAGQKRYTWGISLWLSVFVCVRPRPIKSSRRLALQYESATVEVDPFLLDLPAGQVKD